MSVVGRLSGGINPDSGGTFVPPFKLLKYALHVDVTPNVDV